MRLTFEDDLFPQYLRITLKHRLPQSVIDDYGTRPVRPIFFLCEAASQEWLDTEDIKVVRGNPHVLDIANV